MPAQTAQLKLVHGPDEYRGYIEVCNEVNVAPPLEPPPAVVLVECAEFIILGCALYPEDGVIFASHLAWNPGHNILYRVAALQLAIQAVIMTSTVLNMPVACMPTSKSLRKLLVRAGWHWMDDSFAVMVREPGLTLNRQLPGRKR